MKQKAKLVNPSFGMAIAKIRTTILADFYRSVCHVSKLNYREKEKKSNYAEYINFQPNGR